MAAQMSAGRCSSVGVLRLLVMVVVVCLLPFVALFCWLLVVHPPPPLSLLSCLMHYAASFCPLEKQTP